MSFAGQEERAIVAKVALEEREWSFGKPYGRV